MWETYNSWIVAWYRSLSLRNNSLFENPQRRVEMGDCVLSTLKERKPLGRVCLASDLMSDGGMKVAIKV